MTGREQYIRDNDKREREMNCWDFMKCSPSAYSECPAHPDRGRECWKVTGTKCDGGRQEKASRMEKIAFCSKCGFYQSYALKF